MHKRSRGEGERERGEGGRERGEGGRERGEGGRERGEGGRERGEGGRESVLRRSSEREKREGGGGEEHGRKGARQCKRRFNFGLGRVSETIFLSLKTTNTNVFAEDNIPDCYYIANLFWWG